jgi:hypothetical protein
MRRIVYYLFILFIYLFLQIHNGVYKPEFICAQMVARSRLILKNKTTR